MNADAAREKLAAALDAHTPTWSDIYDETRCTCGADLYPDGIDAHRADALLPVVLELAAEAWDEGHATGWEHCRDGNYGTDRWDDDTPNPYRLPLRAGAR